jgi:hypothetical protein
VAEDARAAARRIVEEVLAARAAADADAAARSRASGDASSPPTTRSTRDGPAPLEAIDPRGGTAALTGGAVADELDERPARVVARRIVEEVLAAHAAAEREVELPTAAGEAAGPPSPAEAVPVQPVPGRAAVVPGAAEAAFAPADGHTGPAAVADDAASIARRIVETVLAEAETRSSTAPPPAARGEVAVAADGATAEIVDGTAADPTDEVPDHVAPTDEAPAQATPADLRIEVPAVRPDDGPPPHPIESVATEDADGTLTLPVTGGGGAATDGPGEAEPGPAVEADQLDAVEWTGALPATDEGDEEDAEATVALPVAHEPAASEDDPEATQALPADEVPASSSDRPEPDRPEPDRGEPDRAEPERAEPERAMTVPAAGERAETNVATLPPRAEPSIEATRPVTVATDAEPDPRRTHWLVASILGAIGLAVLLPLAVHALRTLVALS